MPLLFLKPGFTDHIIRALSWTLIHSLWQGMILAVLGGIIVFFTKKSRPAVRYNLLTAALLVFVGTVVITFFLIPGRPATAIENWRQVPDEAITGLTQAPTAAMQQPSLAMHVVNIFNANANWIVLAWLVIIILRCMRLGLGLYNVYQLKTQQTTSAGDYWNNRLLELCRQLQINKTVRLLQSARIKVPSAIGFFKPLILFPAGMLASLSPDEVEAVLMHELAHIRRRDFFVNMLQQIVEIIFFFNPALQWVSSLMRTEREHCCDDIAVNQTHNKHNYIKALVAFQELSLPAGMPQANAFAGEKDHLITRVKRIINNHNKTLNNMEKKFLAAGLVITSIFIFAFSTSHLQTATLVKKQSTTENTNIPADDKRPGTILPDTMPVKEKGKKHSINGTININGTISNSDNGKQYKIVIVNDEVTELYVDGEKIAAEKMDAYKTYTDKVIRKTKLDVAQSEKDMRAAQKEIIEAKLSQEEAAKEMRVAKVEMETQQQEMNEDMQQAKQELDQEQKEMAKNMQQAKEQVELAQKQVEVSNLDMKRSRQQIEASKKEMVENMVQSNKRMEEAKKEIAQAKLDMVQARKDIEQSKKDVEESKRVQSSLINDFINENIIKNKEELSSYKLNSKELIVNGIKQPEAVHKRISAKYVKGGGNWTMQYNHTDNDDVK